MRMIIKTPLIGLKTIELVVKLGIKQFPWENQVLIVAKTSYTIIGNFAAVVNIMSTWQTFSCCLSYVDEIKT